MAYATKQNMIDRGLEAELIQLTDSARPPVTIDDTKVAAAIADAGSLIDSYVPRATRDLAPVPGILVNHACAIARYYLWKDRASGKVEKDYDNAIVWLKDIAAGRATLGGVAPADTPVSDNRILTSAADRTFTADTLRPFK